MHEACGRPSAWSNPSDLDEKESDGRDTPQGVAPHAHRTVVGDPNLSAYKWLDNSREY